MKQCSKCKKEKDESEFNKKKQSKDGLNSWCRSCNSLNGKQNYINNKENIKANIKKYIENNKDKVGSKKKEYKIKYKQEERTRNKKYVYNRRKTDFLYKLKNDIRSRIRQSFIKYSFSKESNTATLLQCSHEEFQAYLGPKPEGNIDLDHICPCAQAKTEEELIKLQHYTNFRWLDKKDNRKKWCNKTIEAEEMCKKLLGRDWID